MTVKCNIHGVEMKFIPAGVGKVSGKPYKAFNGCPEVGCKETAPATNVVEQAPFNPVKPPTDVWDAKDRTSIAQTAMNVAGNLVAAKANVLGETPTDEMLEHTADFIYNWISGKRGGDK